ncbi:MAG: MFS transporter [Trebonia sp.]
MLASAVGALVFGRVADMLGRKRIYGFEVLILAAGAIASAFAPNYTFLLICRIILGIGIGGGYPVSATIMSEYSGKQSRGRMVGLVFAMQGLGLIVGPLIASIFLGAGVSNNLTWRLLLGLGAIPGLAVFYLRRQIHETPRFAMAGGAVEEAEAAIAAATGGKPAVSTAVESKARHSQSVASGYLKLFQNRRLLIWLIGTAGGWALLDFCYYGNTISQPEIFKLLSPNATLLDNTLIQLGIFVVSRSPDTSWRSCCWTGRDGGGSRSSGFAMMALMFLVIGFVPVIARNALPFLLLYGVSYFFTEFGPNTTTFIYPAELFPVDVRTTGHGIAAGAGKLGAFAGAFLFPDFLAVTLGLNRAMVIAGVAAALGMLLTIATLPEPKGKTLEELEEIAHEPMPAKVRTQPV